MDADAKTIITIVAATLFCDVVLKLLILLIGGGGSLARVWPATRAFFKVLRYPDVAAKVETLLNPEPPKPPKPSAEPLRLLALLQREGRLLDFLLEDLSQASDDQVGAGVRELQRKAQTVIKEHLTLQPVLSRSEGETVEIPAGFDPSAIMVTGNVTGSPPYRGILRHHGWRVTTYRLPAGPDGRDEFVVAQAEVELP